MSIEVELPDVADVLARYRSAYLVTVGGGVRGHVVAVGPTLSEGAIVLADVGSTSRANLLVEPSLTLVWPPVREDDHTLIVDGTGRVEADTVVVLPTRAVLHRPAREAGAGNSACASDCIEVTLPTSP